MLYREQSEHRQVVEEFLRQFRNLHPQAGIEVMDVDKREGIAAIKLYDITRYPSIIALRNDGSILQAWQGEDNIPRLDDISYYALDV